MKNLYLTKLKKAELEILDYIIKICDENNLTYFMIGGTLLGAVRHKGYIPWDDDIDIAMPRKDYDIFIKKFKANEKFILDCNEYNPSYWLPFAKVRNVKTIYREKAQENYQGEEGIWVDIFPLDNSNKENSFILMLRAKLVFFFRSAIGVKAKIDLAKKTKVKDFIIKLFSLLPFKLLLFFQTFIMKCNKNEKSLYFINFGSQYGYKKQTHLKDKFYPPRKITFQNRQLNAPNDYDFVLKKIYGENYMKLPPVEKRITHSPSFIQFEDGEEFNFNEKI